MYATPGDSQSPELMRDWGARAEWALEMARGLETDFVFHVGDLQQEHPDSDRFEQGRLAVKAQFLRSGLPLLIAAGNMDIGDKPDPTMPASWVTDQTLRRWEEDFGPSFHSVDTGDFLFLFLNSQLLNSDLGETAVQREWLERQLEDHGGARAFLFLHMPPFVVDESEPGLGSYDAIGEPARSWLLELCRRHGIEAVFAGHSHFRFLNRVDETRIHILPSTTTTRPGFYEAFAVLPDFQGKADLPKLGFTVLRIFEEGHALQLVRTNGQTGYGGPRDWASVLTCTTVEIPTSHLGAFLRLPIASHSDGAVGYPYNVRHRVRDDYPLLACLELGLRHVRFPIGDLDTPLQAERLRLLRDEGMSLTAMVIWDDSLSAGSVEHLLPGVDVLEVQVPGQLAPTKEQAERLSSVRRPSLEIALSPILMEDVGLVHRRGRSWYQLGELSALEAALSDLDMTVDRAVFGIENAEPAWEAITAFAQTESAHIGYFDFILMLADGDEAVPQTLAAALASACVDGSRLFIDPLQDSDRTASVSQGLLDRLSNPRPAFHAVRNMNSILHGGRSRPASYRPRPLIEIGAGERVLSIEDESSVVWGLTGGDMTMAAAAIDEHEATHATRIVVDPVIGRSKVVSSGLSGLVDALLEVEGGVAVVVDRASR